VFSLCIFCTVLFVSISQVIGCEDCLRRDLLDGAKCLISDCHDPVLCRLRYDTLDEFNVDSKAEYSALSSTRSQKKTKTNKRGAPLIQCREGSPEGIRVTMEERICERDEF